MHFDARAFVLETISGDVAESVDASDLKSDGFGRAGSSPAVPTKLIDMSPRVRGQAASVAAAGASRPTHPKMHT